MDPSCGWGLVVTTISAFREDTEIRAGAGLVLQSLQVNHVVRAERSVRLVPGGDSPGEDGEALQRRFTIAEEVISVNR